MSSAESLAERFCHILTPEPGVPMAKAMLSASVKGSENDPLGFSNKFVEGLNRATSYKGNYDNLFIYYKDEGGRELCLVFHVDKDNNK